MRWWLVASLGLAACASGTRPLPIPDGFVDVDGGGGDDQGVDDLAMPKPDLTPGVDLASSDLGGGCATPFINEVQTDGAGGGTDEFIELYNACAYPMLLTGWKLVYRSATGVTDVTVASFASGSIASHGYYLIANTAYAGTPTPDVKPFASSGLAKTGGAVGLRDPSGALMDSVGWGNANNMFVETTAAVAPATSRSIARHPDGHDTNNNSTDFTDSTPSPKASN
jgi:hypothetical protein